MLAFFNNHLDRTILLKGIHNLFLTVARITDTSAHLKQVDITN